MAVSWARYAWIALGWLFFGLGVAGLFLPILPCTPFMLLSTFCFSRGSERLHQWILSLPRVGPMVRDWEERGAIRLQAKLLATLTIAAGSAYPLFIMPIPVWGKGGMAAVLLLVLAFIWSRPSR